LVVVRRKTGGAKRDRAFCYKSSPEFVNCSGHGVS